MPVIEHAEPFIVNAKPATVYDEFLGSKKKSMKFGDVIITRDEILFANYYKQLIPNPEEFIHLITELRRNKKILCTSLWNDPDTTVYPGVTSIDLYSDGDGTNLFVLSEFFIPPFDHTDIADAFGKLFD